MKESFDRKTLEGRPNTKMVSVDSSHEEWLREQIIEALRAKESNLATYSDIEDVTERFGIHVG